MPAALSASSSPAEGVDIVVEMRDVGMTYRSNGQEVVALEGIDLLVRRGEFVSVIGLSGCGKSTLLRIIADILQPTTGTLLVNGLPAREARLQRQYSFVFQDPVLLPWRTVHSNVGLALEIMRVDAEERNAKVLSLLDRVHLNGFGERAPGELSGGMRMRASLARALTQNPPLLLMDEPFGALDEITRHQMNLELLQVWQQTTASVVFVTHSIEEAVYLSDRVIVLSARPGRVRQEIAIDLPRPRIFDLVEGSPELQPYTQRVRRALFTN